MHRHANTQINAISHTFINTDKKESTQVSAFLAIIIYILHALDNKGFLFCFIFLLFNVAISAMKDVKDNSINGINGALPLKS